MISEEAEYRLEQDKRRAFIRKVVIAGIVIIGLVVFAILAFRSFKLYSEARMKLREAKNIKMTLEVADLEYYSIGTNIYDETAEGNIRKGAFDYVNKIQDNPEGIMRLTGYDSQLRKITGFEYETEKYIVRYSHTEEGDRWQIFQIKELLDY
ncbi:MAG: hypothetical protein J5718_02165 [Lachnospiraceae bacterium]|nr:hypothetical protein [Lachnospiraceae bacterium]